MNRANISKLMVSVITVCPLFLSVSVVFLVSVFMSLLLSFLSLLSSKSR